MSVGGGWLVGWLVEEKSTVRFMSHNFVQPPGLLSRVGQQISKRTQQRSLGRTRQHMFTFSLSLQSLFVSLSAEFLTEYNSSRLRGRGKPNESSRRRRDNLVIFQCFEG